MVTHVNNAGPMQMIEHIETGETQCYIGPKLGDLLPRVHITTKKDV